MRNRDKFLCDRSSRCRDIADSRYSGFQDGSRPPPGFHKIRFLRQVLVMKVVLHHLPNFVAITVKPLPRWRFFYFSKWRLSSWIW